MATNNKVVTGASVPALKNYIDNKFSNMGIDGDLINQVASNTNNIAKSRGATNPNLLDNGWFQIAQAGYGGNHGSSQYIADRWRLYKSTYVSVSNGVGFKPTGAGYGIFQKFEADKRSFIVGKTVTVSVMTTEGNVYSATFTPTTGTTDIVLTDKILAELDDDDLWVYSNDSSYTVMLRSVKLELGSVSTLAYDSPPNYAEELLKCQRYFQYHYRLATSVMSSWTHDGSNYKITYNFPQMRLAPNIVFKESPSCLECPQRTFVALANISIGDVSESTGTINVKAAYAYIGNPYFLCKVEFLADL